MKIYVTVKNTLNYCVFTKNGSIFTVPIIIMKNKLPLISIFILNLCTLLVSCSKKDTAPKEAEKSCIINSIKPIFNTNNISGLPPVSKVTNVCGVMPLGKSYQWIYTDSLFDNNGQFVRIEFDTVKVVLAVQSPADNSIWWKITSRRYKGLPNYVYTTDSVVYAMDLPYNSNGATLKAYPWLQVVPQDSVRKTNMLSDMGYIETIKKLQQATTVPVGSYTGCINVVKHLSNNYDITFKPEVGMVKFVSYAVSGNPFHLLASNKRQVSELVQIIK